MRSPEIAAHLLRALVALPGHEFWIDDVALVTGDDLDIGVAPSRKEVTDAHLIAPARRHQGRLVSFDTKIVRLLSDDLTRLVGVPDEAPSAG